jgi:2-polyprenyl-3-methyl-5-hydroxy-6-metoxy-1,4-benzoquinol methylase
VSCAICGNGRVTSKGQVEGYRAGVRYVIKECAECGVSWADPCKADNDLYEHIYRNVEIVPGYSRYHQLAQVISSKKRPLEYIMAVEDCYHAVGQSLLEEKTRVTKVVEVGCGQGYLTYALRQHGFDATGVDLSKDAIARAEKRFGPSYFRGTLEEYVRSHSAPPSHVVCTELVEHLEDPVAFVRGIFECLPRGGKLILTTPHKLVGARGIWETELPPVHLWWFTRQSLVELGRVVGAKTNFFDFTSFYKEKTIRDSQPGSVKADEPMFDNSYNLLRPVQHGPLHSVKLAAKSLLPDAFIDAVRQARANDSAPIRSDDRSMTLCAIYERA